MEPFKNETEAEGLVLISFFLSVSLSVSLYMKTKMQEWKWQHNIRKTCLTSFTTTVTNWLNSACHPTLKTEDLALRKRNKTQNKTEQNNTKQMRINVKNGVQMRLQECNKNISAAGPSSTHQNNFWNVSSET